MSKQSLATPLALPCGATLNNRLMKSAMTEGLCGPDGAANVRLERLYRRWSEGGAGLLVTGNVMVDARYLERFGNLIMEADCDQPAMAALARAGTAAGNHLWAQLNHPGRQSPRMVTGQPVAPSAVRLRIAGNFATPRPLTPQQIHKIVGRFADAAEISQACGFTGVQIHAAHGYLISQFLSPVVNRREDEWGGRLANRARFLLAVVAAVRERVGNRFPVAVKLNSADFQKGGFTLEECQQVAAWLGDAGIDLLEISGGTYEQLRLVGLVGDEREAQEPATRASTRQREAYFLQYAQAIRASTDVPLAVTGGFRSVETMHTAVAEAQLDVIGLARPFCVQPDLARAILQGELSQAPTPELSLRLGKAQLFGPDSRSNTLRSLNGQATVAWFYRQMIEIAEGREVPISLSAASAWAQHLGDEMRMALARRRWRRQQG